MKSGILTIMKKELARFFGDKRTVAGVLLPGVMIYVLYSFMGTAMGSVFGVEEDYVPSIQAVRLPQSIAALADSAGMALTEGEEAGLPAAMDQVAGQELDLLVVFPEDFDQAVADYSVASGEPAPHVEVYYSSVSTASQSAYMAFTGLLDSYESLLANKFDVNAGEGVYDLATAEESTGALFAMLMPMLLMMFLYSGCSAVAPESIAGEKERGTIATMLVTPIRRSDIAVGKILALAVITVLSGASSTLGTILSLPNLMGGAAGEMDANIYGVRDYLLLAAVMSSFLGMVLSLPKIIGVSVGSFVGSFGFLSYFMLLLLILSLVPLIVAIISVVSTASRTVKESSGYTSVIMVITMVLSLVASFVSGIGGWSVVVPILNAVVAMQNILTGSYVVWQCLVSVLMNLVYTAVIVFVMAKMLSSERIMFGK